MRYAPGAGEKVNPVQEERPMRKLTLALGAAVIALLAQAGTVKPGAAAIIYPWCAHYHGADIGGGPSCGSTTYAQCMATVSGQMGYCERNPWYVEPVRQPVRRHKNASR
jgi:hypothetical protein